MWYDNEGNIVDIRQVVDDISYDHLDDFCPDDLIDDTYPPVKIFQATFYPSRILKELDPILYQMVEDEERTLWVEDVLDEIDRYAEDGDTLMHFIGFAEGDDYVFREEQDD